MCEFMNDPVRESRLTPIWPVVHADVYGVAALVCIHARVRLTLLLALQFPGLTLLLYTLTELRIGNQRFDLDTRR
jgi:hypothetical protein